MAQFDWATLAVPVRDQINQLHTAVRGILAGNLSGAYLHGSLGMGCFQPGHSDVDALLVAREPLGNDARRQLTAVLLALSGTPCPLEVHVLTEQALVQWMHPLPFAFHYSELWRLEYERQLAAGEAQAVWCPPGIFADRDLAAHLVMVRQFGIALQGPAPEHMFPQVPRRDYVDAILSDVLDISEWIHNKPVYGVLNLCRVLQFLREGTVASKDQVGEWGVRCLPERWQPLAASALATYRGHPALEDEFSAQGLDDFATFMLREIQRAMTHGKGTSKDWPAEHAKWGRGHETT